MSKQTKKTVNCFLQDGASDRIRSLKISIVINSAKRQRMDFRYYYLGITKSKIYILPVITCEKCQEATFGKHPENAFFKSLPQPFGFVFQ